ncbi:FG-GAP-like repeat-containing protein [Streptomyces hydrogenans]|uniref:FG-GAP-like repeat-containing protein n=1 Tax=Streptomyces hydrogenans TaxID=1873719 RepID=UPI0036844815
MAVAALSAPMAGSAIAADTLTGPADLPFAFEDGSYPNAEQIFTEKGIKLVRGDGNITLVDCDPTIKQIRVMAVKDESVNRQGTYCFASHARTGLLTLELDRVFAIDAGDQPLSAELTAEDGTSKTVTIAKDGYASVGEGQVGGSRSTLIEIRVTGPGETAPAPSGDATLAFTGKLTIGDSERMCTATLVDRDWVLTAKSCFADDPSVSNTVTAGVPKKKTTLTVGRTDLNTSGGHTTDVTKLVPHPDRDLVMARLARRATNVTPVALSATTPAAGEMLTFAGFGRTAGEWAPSKLHTGAFAVDTVEPSGVALTPSSPADATVCKGDAGAPLLRIENGKPALVALGSRSSQAGCLGSAAGADLRSWDTRTDDIRAWITATALRPQGDMTGDKIGDLTAVWDDSTLHSYPGLGTGQLGSQIPLIGGTTWSTIKHLTKGDFTGDGIADLMSIWGDGTLHYYRGKGDGTIDTQRVVTLGGDTWLPIRNIAAGDFNKDGVDDLITIWGDGTLHLYTGKGDGQLNNGITVSQGAATWLTVKHTAAGDFNKDGVADLMAIWGDGSLHLYTGKGDGQLNNGTTMIGGTTWSTIKHLTAGDYNKDGVADLKAVWNDGTLRYYSGKGDGTINTQIQVTVGGTTWGSVRQLA